jgi:predicted alpha-1,2-mannosidase
MRRIMGDPVATRVSLIYVALLSMFFSALLCARSADQRSGLADYVNPLVGTSGPDNANGHTFPGATLPFGMLQWSPETNNGFIRGHAGSYLYYDKLIRGFSLNHVNGPGCYVFGDVPILPLAGGIRTSPASDSDQYSAPFSHANETASAGSYAVQLDSGIKVELTSTVRTGLGRFSFPKMPDSTFLFNVGRNSTKVMDAAIEIQGDHKLSGKVVSGDFCGSKNRYTVYFVAEFDRPFEAPGTWKAGAVSHGSRTSIGPASGAFVSFNTLKNNVVLLKTAISYVSVENAWLNLYRENPGWGFDRVRHAAQETWNQELERIELTGGSTEEKKIFYTALYHAVLQPNIFDDVNGQYIGFDNRTHVVRSRHQYANFSGWDIYRSQVQLLALLHPKETSDMIQSLLADQQQGGALPLWPLANDETCSMVGDPSDAVIADAYAFGAVSFDTRAALKAMVNGATDPHARSKNCAVRKGVEDYLKFGYLGPDSGSGPAQTLEFTTADFSIAQFAKQTGDIPAYHVFLRRSQFWKNIFNPQSGYIEPRHNDGSYLPNLNPGLEEYDAGGKKAHHDRWVEGNAAQYSWMVPYNLRSLFDLMGGNDKVVRRLDDFFTKLNVGSNEPFFWMGNEPVFAVPWAYDFAGAPWRTQEVVRRIETELFSSQADGIPGNDDLGATSAWYVFAASGLYPAIPAVGGFCLNSPLFPSLIWHLGNKQTLRVVGLHASAPNSYVQSLTVNRAVYDSSWLTYERLARGANLVFELSDKPNKKWASAPLDGPPSFDDLVNAQSK